MEDEGIVVYFKNSAAAQAVGGDARLIVPEEHETNPLDQLDPSLLDPQEPHHTPDSHPSAVKATFQSRLTVLCKELIHRFSGCGIWSHSDAQEILPSQLHLEQHMLRVGIIKEIIKSPLLTEEDFQLLSFALPTFCDDLPPSQNEGLQFHISSQGPSVTGWIHLQPLLHFMVAVFVAVLVVNGWWFMACVVTMMTIVFIILKMYCSRRLRRSVDQVSGFLHTFESLLSLLMATVRTIQEAEVIACGYTRPSRMVPVARIEGQGGGYQCLPLRRRVFATCVKGLRALRKAAQDLSHRYPLAQEVARCGLAMTSLDQLHAHMTQPWVDAGSACDGGMEREEEEEEKPSHLSLESVKDGCRLLAVQNSEYLCYLTLCLSHLYGASLDVHPLHLPDISPELVDLCTCLNSLHTELNWSNEFHKNQYFGNSPKRHKSTHHTNKEDVHELSGVVEDIHCLDLKAQLTLKRIRALGSHLEQLCGTEQQNIDLDDLRGQVLLVKEGLGSAQEHVHSCLRCLDKLSAPQPPTPDVDGQVPSEAPLASDEQTVEEMGETRDNEDTSDDEMVFEAYIPPGDENTMGDSEEEEGGATDQISSQVPIDMVKELQSVLSVRNSQRQQRREERRMRRGVAISQLEHHPPTADQGHSPWVADPPLPAEVSTTVDHISDHLATEGQRDTSSIPLLPVVCSTEKMVDMIRLAAAAAAAAKVTEEIVFEDDT